MTIGEMFREEGRQEGRQEAKQEFEKKIVLRLLQTDMSDDEISAITDLPPTVIESLRLKETMC